ncbi:MAG: CBS domain-containing protein [Veillonellales bacterium]
MKAQDIMEKEVVSVNQQATVREIAQVLLDHKISGVPVVDDAGDLVGIVTEGDLLHKEMSPRIPHFVNILGAIIYYNGVRRYDEDFKKLMAGQACEMMTKKVITVDEDADIDAVVKLMIEHGIKRIPVVKDNKVLGIVSRRDIIRALLH